MRRNLCAGNNRASPSRPLQFEVPWQAPALQGDVLR